VYWNLTIIETGVTYHGTYNSTLVFTYSTATDLWVLEYSQNLLSGEPVCTPSALPTASPTASPTAAPTANSSAIQVFVKGVYKDVWDDVALLIESPTDPNYFSDFPDAGNNPKETILEPSDDGMYLVSALFPSGPPVDVDEHDLLCNVRQLHC
jgi:hypothetical protein